MTRPLSELPVAPLYRAPTGVLPERPRAAIAPSPQWEKIKAKQNQMHLVGVCMFRYGFLVGPRRGLWVRRLDNCSQYPQHYEVVGGRKGISETAREAAERELTDVGLPLLRQEFSWQGQETIQGTDTVLDMFFVYLGPSVIPVSHNAVWEFKSLLHLQNSPAAPALQWAIEEFVRCKDEVEVKVQTAAEAKMSSDINNKMEKD